MIIDVTGFGWSGSGAVHDLLREYEDVKFAAFDYDWEFTLLWEPDGIYDLEHKLCYKHCRFGDSNIAIKRFLSLTDAQSKTPSLHYDKLFKGEYKKLLHKYVDDLIQLKFEGHTFEEILHPDFRELYLHNYNRIVRRLIGNSFVRKITKKDVSYKFTHQNNHIISLSYNPDNFLERTHLLMEKLFSYLRDNSDIPLVTDQLFPPDCPGLFFKYIKEPSKCIVVRRDPRDTYLLAKQAYHSNIPLPVNNVDDFILFYKKTIEEPLEKEGNQLLNIQFEDLIYNYEATVSRIENFLGINRHVRIKDYFDPCKSINNTQLFNLYDGYQSDIKKIEMSLPNSIFHFENYQNLGKNRSQVF